METETIQEIAEKQKKELRGMLTVRKRATEERKTKLQSDVKVQLHEFQICQTPTQF